MSSRVTCSEQRFLKCFYDYISASVPVDEFVFILTPLANIQTIKIDSRNASLYLDSTRDAFMCVIMLFASIMYFFVMDGFVLWPKRYFLPFLGTVFWFGTYFLWILTMSYIPLRFGVLYDESYEYWGELQHSITFYIGSSWDGAIWWVYGVLLHGLWSYVLFLFYPSIACLFAMAKCCCYTEKGIKYRRMFSRFVERPVTYIGMAWICLVSVGYAGIFIKLVASWNNSTYEHLSNRYSVCSLVGCIMLFGIIPVQSCLMRYIPNKRILELQERETKTAGKNVEMTDRDGVANTPKRSNEVHSYQQVATDVEEEDLEDDAEQDDEEKVESMQQTEDEHLIQLKHT